MGKCTDAQAESTEFSLMSWVRLIENIDVSSAGLSAGFLRGGRLAPDTFVGHCEEPPPPVGPRSFKLLLPHRCEPVPSLVSRPRRPVYLHCRVSWKIPGLQVCAKVGL